jgi:hypothetical protein
MKALHRLHLFFDGVFCGASLYDNVNLIWYAFLFSIDASEDNAFKLFSLTS